MKKHTVTTYTLNFRKPGIPSGRIRTAFLTDLHCSVWENSADYLPGLIADLKPDLILCGGDMITARPGMSVEIPLDFMRRMLDMAPVIFSLGNHEYRSRIYPETYGTMYEEFMHPLTQAGMIVLDNEKTRLKINEIPLSLYGLSITREKYARFHNRSLSTAEMEEKIGRADPETVSILLAHNPKFYKTYLEWGADITLCGHYHGGIVRFGRHSGLISPGLMPFPHNAYGRFDRNGKTLIVGAGLGEHTIPLRIHNPKELVMLELIVNGRRNEADGHPCETGSI